MKNEKVWKIAMTGVFAALSYVVFTFLQFKLPEGNLPTAPVFLRRTYPALHNLSIHLLSTFYWFPFSFISKFIVFSIVPPYDTIKVLFFQNISYIIVLGIRAFGPEICPRKGFFSWKRYSYIRSKERKRLRF